LQNRNKRKKNLDENELKAIINCFPNIISLTMNKAPINDALLGSFLPSFSNLITLHIPNTPRLSNSTLSVIAKCCVALEDLHLGGAPTDYNL